MLLMLLDPTFEEGFPIFLCQGFGLDKMLSVSSQEHPLIQTPTITLPPEMGCSPSLTILTLQTQETVKMQSKCLPPY